MTVKLGVVMDPISEITVKKDSTLAMLLAAQARGWALQYMELNDLFFRDGICHGRMRALAVRDDPQDWFDLGEPETRPLSQLQVVLMRKDPPFDMEYIYATYLLERAEQAGVLVVNKPQSLRDANEKMVTAWFPQCCPPTLVTRELSRLYEFLHMEKQIIVKPLDGMGGASIFRVNEGEANTTVIFETMTRHQSRFIMAQRFLPEIRDGDKRVLLINGEPLAYALARVPAQGDARGNLAAGATGVGVELGERERWLAAQIGPALRDKGLLFVGLDVIGDYVTEINVTSPTCIRELDAIYGLDIGAQLMDTIETLLGK
ncbi:MAG: glutathione synthase [Gammaproteobacteria bacterium]|nr:MAG: glutathione synthase [Gammaproteobacteria bacterium]